MAGAEGETPMEFFWLVQPGQGNPGDFREPAGAPVTLVEFRIRDPWQ